MIETPAPKEPDPSGQIETPTHKLVSSLLGETPPPYDSAVLIGFFGPSQKDGYVRLYVTLDLRSYYEISRDEIAYKEQVEPGNDNSPTRVLIKNASGLERKQILVVSPETSFVKGSVASEEKTASEDSDSSGTASVAFAFAAAQCLPNHPHSH